MKDSLEKQAIVARLASTRGQLSDHLAELGDKANLPRRFRHSFAEHPFTWLAGSLAAGVAVSSILKVGEKRRGTRHRSKRRSAEEIDDGIEPTRPLLMGALAFAGNRLMAMSMPAIRHFVETEMTRWLGDRVHAWRDARAADQPAGSAQTASPGDAVRPD